MDATTSPSPDARIARFSRAERWVHRSITVLMIVLIATAAALYFPDISVLVCNRAIVSNIHCAGTKGALCRLKEGEYQV